ncbi:MAG: hypothetical protein R3C59_30960 [Planctomycetaceae bacterium]
MLKLLRKYYNFIVWLSEPAPRSTVPVRAGIGLELSLLALYAMVGIGNLWLLIQG